LSLVFFTDRDLGKRFPEILRAAGLYVERHDDLFPESCPDEVWLQHVGSHGRIAITHDSRIRYKPNELAAVLRHRVALLVVSGKASYPKLAEEFVATMPRIVTFLSGRQPPFIARVKRPTPGESKRCPGAPGTVSLWYPR